MFLENLVFTVEMLFPHLSMFSDRERKSLIVFPLSFSFSSSSKTNVFPLEDDNRVLTHDNKQMGGILNGNFSSVFTIVSTETAPLKPNSSRGMESLNFGNIHYVQQIFVKLDTNKSIGPDYLFPMLFIKLK